MRKVSVITVCKNAELDISSTVLSVINQSYDNVEYVIIDGESQDDTLKIIQEHEDNIDILISEKDHGVYDAMNKGILACSGEIIYLLNAGDVLANEKVIETVMHKFNTSDVEMVYGNVVAIDKTTESRRLFTYEQIDKIFLYKNTICHQSIFCTKSVFDQYGLFDTSLSIRADYEWVLSCFFTHELRTEYLAAVISHTTDGGLSDTNYDVYSVTETPVILRRHFYAFSRAILDNFVFLRQLLFISRRLLKVRPLRFFLNSLIRTK